MRNAISGDDEEISSLKGWVVVRNSTWFDYLSLCPCMSFQNWERPGLSCLLMCFLLCFLNCFWAARSCSDVWLSFRSFGGTGTTDDNPWKQPRWNKQCGLEWFDYLIACASTSKRVKFSDICSVTLLLCVSVVQPPTEEIAQFHTIPGCALCEARTEWIQSGIGIHRHMQRSCLLDHSVSVFPWPCVLWGCVCRRQERR